MSKLSRPALSIALVSAAMLAGNSAVAQETDGWSGEAAFSAGYTTGNTETTDLGLGIDVAREQGVWTYEFVAEGDYGEQDGAESPEPVLPLRRCRSSARRQTVCVWPDII